MKTRKKKRKKEKYQRRKTESYINLTESSHQLQIFDETRNNFARDKPSCMFGKNRRAATATGEKASPVVRARFEPLCPEQLSLMGHDTINRHRPEAGLDEIGRTRHGMAENRNRSAVQVRGLLHPAPEMESIRLCK